jgi:MarR family transcriptional regulator for hemolysin
VHDALDTRLAEQGASLWHWVLLKEASFAEGASQRELARQMHIEPPSLVRQLDTLAAAGYVERRPDPEDRRVSRVHVTAAGQRRLTQLNRVAAKFDGELRAVLDDEQIDVLGAALLTIHERFSSTVHATTTRGAQV